MSKRIISILILIAMLFTACSETSDVQEDTQMSTDIYNLPDDDVINTPQTDANGEVAQDDTAVDPEVENGDTSPDQSEPSSDVPTEQTETSTAQPEPTENNNEPTNSEAEAPTESEEPVKEVDPEQLAALTLFALSMEYPDFMLQGFYATNSDSKGIYAIFESGGSTLTAHIYPIAKERTAAGTMDIFANEIGFAAFDLVASADDNYDEIPEEKYAVLLSELSGVSVFSH